MQRTSVTCRRSIHRHNSKSALAPYLAATAVLATGCLSNNASAQTGVTNPVSGINITVDGKFDVYDKNGNVTGAGIPTPGSGVEWSDITPLAFISPVGPGNTNPLLATNIGDPNANTLLYAGLDPGKDDLYLAYDFSGRTNPFLPGDTIASIQFPFVLPTGSPLAPNGGSRDLTVTFKMNNQKFFPASTLNGNSIVVFQPFSILVSAPAANGDPLFNNVDASQFGMQGAFGFSPSLLTNTPHLVVELAVPLDIPAGFSTVLPPTDVNPPFGGYSPAPAFWNAFATDNSGDPPISSAFFQINPDGSTFLRPNVPTVTPEPGGLALLGVGLLPVLAQWRRRRPMNR